MPTQHELEAATKALEKYYIAYRPIFWGACARIALEAAEKARNEDAKTREPDVMAQWQAGMSAVER